MVFKNLSNKKQQFFVETQTVESTQNQLFAETAIKTILSLLDNLNKTQKRRS